MYISMLVLLAAVASASHDAPFLYPARLVNGVVIEGAVTDVLKHGLVIKTSKGTVTYPWRYLSSGTRYRYRDRSQRAVSTVADETGDVEE